MGFMSLQRLSRIASTLLLILFRYYVRTYFRDQKKNQSWGAVKAKIVDPFIDLVMLFALLLDMSYYHMVNSGGKESMYIAKN